MAVRMVVTRSAADTPVGTPSRASMETVKPVPWREVFSAAIGGKPSVLARSLVRIRQTMPEQVRISRFICSGVMVSAGSMAPPVLVVDDDDSLAGPQAGERGGDTLGRRSEQ